MNEIPIRYCQLCLCMTGNQNGFWNWPAVALVIVTWLIDITEVKEVI